MIFKKISLLVLLFLSFNCFSQKQQIEYYDNGQIKAIGNLDENGELIDEWKIYYENGNLQAIVTVIKPGTGVKKEYFENGNLKSIENNKDYMLNGLYKIYNDESKLLESGNYIADKKTGIWEENIYYSNGNLKEEKNIIYDDKYPSSYYDKEIRHGLYKSYFENKQLKESIEYEFGKPIGKYHSYFDNGNKKESGYLTKNGYDGLKLEYYETGKMKNKKFYIDGKKHGDWIYYYEDGAKKRIVKYNNNEKLEEIEIEELVEILEIEEDFAEYKESETVYKVHIKSKCNETIRVLLRRLDDNDKWISEGWWTIEPGKDVYIVDSKNAIIYYFAMSNSGIWKGDLYREFEGKRYAFKKWDMSNNERGIITKILSCNH